MPYLLNSVHEAFAQHYALNGHIGHAAASVGLLDRRQGHALLHRKDIDARIQEILHQRFSKAGITADRTMKELARIAFADIRELYDNAGNLLPVHELSDDAAATVGQIKIEVAGKGDGAGGREMVVTKTIKMADKMAALGLLARHFKIVGDEGDGVNALANLLADRLNSARRRDNANASDARIVDPDALPAPDGQGMRLEYGINEDPSNANDVSNPRLVLPRRNSQALHSELPTPIDVREMAHIQQGTGDEDELW